MEQELRYAHLEGLTDVCFSQDGHRFISCGADGDVRIWSNHGDGNEDPIHICVGEYANSVREKGGKLYVATGSNDIQILTLPNGERDGLLDRFVAPINQIAVSADSEHMALAGEDMQVKLIEFEENGKKVHVFDEIKGPVLSVAVNSKFVAASSGDGKLRVWSVDDKKLLTEIDCFDKVNSYGNATCLCRIDFQPKNKQYLAFPEKQSIVLLSSQTWARIKSLSCAAISSDYSIVQFSPCANYLAASTLLGDVVIFEVNSEKVIYKTKCVHEICGLAFNPTDSEQIIHTDRQGQLGIINRCIPNASSPRKDDEDLLTENNVDFGDIQFDDDDDENVVSLDKIKKQVMGDDEESELNFDARSERAPTPRPRTPEIPLQEAFMPSSSPEHLNPRYLCWNEIGVVRCYGEVGNEDSERSIETEFHDSTFHNSMILQNYQDYKFGSLSKSALVVGNTRQIYVIPLSASSKEWILKLDEGPEEIVLVAASDNLICFGLSNYMVRVCSIYGTQMGVISIPGPLVSMASYQNIVIVAYHSGPVRKNDQCLDMKLIKFQGLTLTSENFKIALGPESTLSWLGFSNCGTPTILDSLGNLCMYKQKTWIPMCDTTKQLKSPSDTLFVTAIDEAHQCIVGIICRGSIYPGFIPRPTVCEVNLLPPFTENATEKTQLESNLFAWSNLQFEDIENKFINSGLKTFVLACKNNLDQRAFELMEILGNSKLLNLSTKYAIKLNKKNMAEKLMELANRLMTDDDDDIEPLDSTPVLKAPTKRFSISSIKRTPKTPRPILQETAVADLPESQNSMNFSLSTTLNDTVVVEEQRNPFAKSTKQSDELSNPLSLINRYAGVEFSTVKENKVKNSEIEKRKQPDSATDKQKEKQRKLDKFMFSRRTQD